MQTLLVKTSSIAHNPIRFDYNPIGVDLHYQVRAN